FTNNPSARPSGRTALSAVQSVSSPATGCVVMLSEVIRGSPMRWARGFLARVILLALVALAGFGPAAPASAADWVQNFIPTQLWSGPDSGAMSFGTVPQWEYFQIAGTQVAGRLYVVV